MHVYIYISLSSEYLHHMETEEAQEMTQMSGKTQPPDWDAMSVTKRHNRNL